MYNKKERKDQKQYFKQELPQVNITHQTTDPESSGTLSRINAQKSTPRHI